MTQPSQGAASPDLTSPNLASPGLAGTVPDSAECATLELPARLDFKAAEALKAEFLAHRGHGLTLDAGKVEHLGAIGLQLIRSAARSWAEDGHVLAFVGASNDLADQMVLLGFTPETITRWEPA